MANVYQIFYQTGESSSVKYANFWPKLYLLIQKLLHLHGIFWAKKDRTIKYFEIFIKQISVKSILLSL